MRWIFISITASVMLDYMPIICFR